MIVKVQYIQCIHFIVIQIYTLHFKCVNLHFDTNKNILHQVKTTHQK